MRAETIYPIRASIGTAMTGGSSEFASFVGSQSRNDDYASYANDLLLSRILAKRESVAERAKMEAIYKNADRILAAFEIVVRRGGLLYRIVNESDNDSCLKITAVDGALPFPVWMTMLPTQHRTLAVHAWYEHTETSDPERGLYCDYFSLSDALLCGFPWRKTGADPYFRSLNESSVSHQKNSTGDFQFIRNDDLPHAPALSSITLGRSLVEMPVEPLTWESLFKI